MSENTLRAFADHGEVHGRDGEAGLAQFATIRINAGVLATNLQDEGPVSFVNSWNDLMNVIEAKSAALQTAS